MPTMASITVKKNDGTTDIVYDALSGSGGDSSPAAWRQDTGAPAALPVGLRSTLKVMSKDNGPKTARQLRVNYAMPYAVQDSTTTLYSAKDKVVFEGIFTLPLAIPASVTDEAVAQLCNLMASDLVKAMARSGYAAT